MKELPVSAMYPAGGVAPYGRPSMGTRDEQEVGSPMAMAASGETQGSNPSIEDSTSMFGKGPSCCMDQSSPSSNPTPAMPGA